MSDTFQWIVGVKNVSSISGWAGIVVGEIELQGNAEVLSDEWVVVMASEAIDISHHTCWSMEDLEKIAKEFLSPATDLVNGAVVLQDFFDGTAVAEPKEFGAPQEFPILAYGPTTTAGLAHKRMVMAFPLSATARAKADWP